MSPVTMPWLAASDGRRRLAGQDAGAGLQRRSAPTSAPSAVDRVDQLERGPDGALGVVLVRDGCPPHRHHGVADELLDDAAVALDRLASGVEVPGHQVAHLLGVAAVREVRRTRRGRRRGPRRAGARSTASTERRCGRPPGPRPCRARTRTPHRTCCRARSGAAQAGQTRTSAEPHSMQNLRPASFVVPHARSSPGPLYDGGAKPRRAYRRAGVVASARVRAPSAPAAPHARRWPR